MTTGLTGRGKELAGISWDEFFARGRNGEIINRAQLPQLKRALGALQRPHESGGAITPAFVSGHTVADLANLPDVEIQRLVSGVGPTGVRVLEEVLFGLLELGVTASPAKPRQIKVESLLQGFDETAGVEK